MTMPSQDQILGMLRIFIPYLLTMAVAKGYIPEGAVADVTTAIVTLVAIGWSAVAHKQSAVVARVAAMPEVSKVEVAPTAAGIALKAAAGSSPDALITVAPKK